MGWGIYLKVTLQTHAPTNSGHGDRGPAHPSSVRRRGANWGQPCNIASLAMPFVPATLAPGRSILLMPPDQTGNSRKQSGMWNTQLNPISQGTFLSWLPRGGDSTPLWKIHFGVSEPKSFLHSHLYIYRQLKSKRTSF